VAVTLALALAVSSFPIQAAESSHIQFENRQKRSGVWFVLDNGTLPDKPMIDGIPGGVALLDYDDDGYLDIFFTTAHLPTLPTLPGFVARATALALPRPTMTMTGEPTFMLPGSTATSFITTTATAPLPMSPPKPELPGFPRRGKSSGACRRRGWTMIMTANLTSS